MDHDMEFRSSLDEPNFKRLSSSQHLRNRHKKPRVYLSGMANSADQQAAGFDATQKFAANERIACVNHFAKCKIKFDHRADSPQQFVHLSSSAQTCQQKIGSASSHLFENTALHACTPVHSPSVQHSNNCTSSQLEESAERCATVVSPDDSHHNFHSNNGKGNSCCVSIGCDHIDNCEKTSTAVLKSSSWSIESKQTTSLHHVAFILPNEFERLSPTDSDSICQSGKDTGMSESATDDVPSCHIVVSYNVPDDIGSQNDCTDDVNLTAGLKTTDSQNFDDLLNLGEDGPFICTICTPYRHFKNLTGIRNHAAWKHSSSAVPCSSTEARFTCTECAAHLRSSAALALHMRRSHAIVREHQCKLCSVRFVRLSKLRSHLSAAHGISSFHCDVCSAVFKSREGWRIHMQKQHTADEPAEMCTTCGKVFKLRAELRSHMRVTHSAAEDSFVCDLCQRSFKYRPSLRRHLMTYHSKERHFQCDICTSRFKTRNDLMNHRRLHLREFNPLPATGRGSVSQSKCQSELKKKKVPTATLR